MEVYTLEPEEIWESPTISAIDVAIKRSSASDGPEDIEILVVYIEDGETHVARMEDGDLSPLWRKLRHKEWIHLGTMGPASDVAVEYDGYWIKPDNQEGIWWARGHEGTRWLKVSEGEPWIFRLHEGTIYAHEGIKDTDPTELASDGVEQCHAIRGWKNVRFPDRDFGLVVAYIRDDNVFYRNRAEQENGDVIWEPERPDLDSGDDPLFDGNASYVYGFRTNDYRMGLLAVVNGDTEWIITERNWAGMAIDDEVIFITLDQFSLDLIGVTYHDVETEETITAGLTNMTTWMWWAQETEPLTAENVPVDWERTDEELGEADGVTTVFPIDYEPLEDSETIYVDGTEQDSEGYTIYPVDHEEYGYMAEIHFDEAPESGTVTADYFWENWGRRLRLVMTHGVRDSAGQDDYFLVRDNEESSYSVYDTEPVVDEEHKPAQTPAHPDWGDVLFRIIEMDTADLNTSSGDLKIEYDGEGDIVGEAKQDVGLFEITFTPQNLIILELPLPEVEEIFNV